MNDKQIEDRERAKDREQRAGVIKFFIKELQAKPRNGRVVIDDSLRTTAGFLIEVIEAFAIQIRDEAQSVIYKQGFDAGYCNGLAAKAAEIKAVLEKVDCLLRGERAAGKSGGGCEEHTPKKGSMPNR